MNIFEFVNEHIKQRLDKWTADRFISIELSRNIYHRLVNEELTEFIDALNNNDKQEMIDALCDMIVVTYNIIKDEYSTKAIEINRDSIRQSSFETDEVEFKQAFKTNMKGCFYNYIAEIYNEIENKEEKRYISVFRFIHFCLTIIEVIGGDKEQAIDECFKVIESRTQDEEQKEKWKPIIERGETPTDKWKKDQRPEIQATWYKANYIVR